MLPSRHWNHPNYWRNLFYNNSVTFEDDLKSSLITDEICFIIIVLPSRHWNHPNYWRNLSYNNSVTFKTLKSSQLLTKSVLSIEIIPITDEICLIIIVLPSRHWNHPNYWRNLSYNNSVTFKTSSQLLTKSVL